MNITIWIIQGILAALFLMAGIMKITLAKDKLREKVGGWVDNVPGSGIKLIGLLEFAAAIGLVVPMLLDILPVLTPIAAIGLAMTMVGAMITHAVRKEYKEMLPNILFMGLAIFVAVGRLMLEPVI